DTVATLNVNYTIGTSSTYVNQLLGSAEPVEFRVDTFTFGSLNGTPYLIVEDKGIKFRYSFDVQDRIQSMLALANLPGFGSDYSDRTIFMTRDLLKGNTDILWHMIAGE